MAKIKFNNVTSPDQLDPYAQKVYNALVGGMPKKNVCNKYHVDMTSVIGLCKHFCIGSKINKPYTNETEIVTEEISLIEPKPIDENATEVKAKLSQLTDDEIIQVAIDIENGLHVSEIMEKNSVSRTIVRSIAKNHDLALNTREFIKHAKNKERNSVSESIKESILKDYESGNEINTICNTYNISQCYLREIISEFGKNDIKRVRKQRKSLTDSEKASLVNDILSGMTYNEAAVKYDISHASVYRYINNYKFESNNKNEDTKQKEGKSDTVKVKEDTIDTITENEKENKDEDKMKTDTSDNITDENKEFKIKKLNSRVLSCGLVAKRHEIPVDKYIFDDINTGLMFNFDKQREICLEFINKHIEFVNGEPNKIIELYATGLQSALATVQSVCTELKIPLTIMHYDAVSMTYKSQSVFTGAKNINQYSLPKFGKCRDIYLCGGITEEEILSSKPIYLIVNKGYYVDGQKTVVKYIDYYYFSKNCDMSELWKLYGSLVMKDKDTLVIVSESYVKDNIITDIEVISRSPRNN